MTFTYAQIEKKWDYPIKPGTKEWLKLEDNASKVKVCQIPETVLATISTNDLFEVVLNYPLIYDVYAFVDINEGIKKLMNDFNGIRELFKRSGVLTLFVDEYVGKNKEIIPVLDNHVHSNVSKGEAIMYLSLLETLSTTKILLEKSSVSEKQMILQAIKQGIENKKNRADYFSGFGFSTIDRSIESLKSEKTINLEPLTSLTSFYDQPIFVYTPFGTAVRAWKRSESSIQTRAAFDDTYTRKYPAAQKIITYDGYSSTAKFNCHGYAWHRVENGNNSSADVWIGYSSSERDPENTYITDGSYKKETKNVPNAKIVWSTGDHTAVNIDNTWCTSKWNEYPLMKHKIGDSPYGSSNLTYYTKTPVLITGASTVVGTSTASYTVNYIPYNYTLTWNYRTDLLTLVSSSAKGIVVKPKTSTTVGDATIQAVLTNSSGDVKTIQHDVGVNGPHYNNVKLSVRKSSDGSEAYPSGGLCPNSYYYAYLTVEGTTLTNVDWGASSQLQVISASNRELYFGTSSQGWGTLNITSTTSYGVRKQILGVTLGGGGSNCNNTYYSISLIPSSDILEINFDMDKFHGEINEKYYTKAASFDIRIYSIISGNMVKQARSSGENIQLDISNVPDGIYTVHIYDGISNIPQTQKMSIKH